MDFDLVEAAEIFSIITAEECKQDMEVLLKLSVGLIEEGLLLEKLRKKCTEQERLDLEINLFELGLVIVGFLVLKKIILTIIILVFHKIMSHFLYLQGHSRCRINLSRDLRDFNSLFPHFLKKLSSLSRLCYGMAHEYTNLSKFYMWSIPSS